jgi:hypothetical protein
MNAEHSLKPYLPASSVGWAEKAQLAHGCIYRHAITTLSHMSVKQESLPAAPKRLADLRTQSYRFRAAKLVRYARW